ncbi:MAG TPA: hypothetical protein VE377_22160 [Candidatus Dormibacteraeota bacterium]|nr:hypothetical protein [Candidatus Dormibacteraeota bacterium]
MRHFRRFRGQVWPLALALLSAAGCSRPTGVPTEGATQASQAPFQDQGNVSGKADPHDSSPSENAAAGVGPSLPFHDSQSLPAGTLLTVRLKAPITTGTPGGDDSFEASIDQAVVVDGNTLIPRGASVAGRVQSAGISHVKPSRGYVRLALETVHLGGVDVPIHTVSLFTRSPQDDSGVTTIRLEKGRRLTFRLTEPVSVSFQRAQASH